jgi:hypothetical protein
MDPEAAKWPPRSMMCRPKTPNAGGYRRQYPSTPVTLHEQVFEPDAMLATSRPAKPSARVRVASRKVAATNSCQPMLRGAAPLRRAAEPISGRASRHSQALVQAADPYRPPLGVSGDKHSKRWLSRR